MNTQSLKPAVPEYIKVISRFIYKAQGHRSEQAFAYPHLYLASFRIISSYKPPYRILFIEMHQARDIVDRFSPLDLGLLHSPLALLLLLDLSYRKKYDPVFIDRSLLCRIAVSVP
mmetsp:Transcript_31357/g.5651  ORF Transcript_31357/g.5651 Transcript_31357/m.5651 type:complete len:115 (+) Transcript_31357:707-1051(+)